MNTEKIKAVIETEIVCSADGKHTYEVIKRLDGIEGEKGCLISLYSTRDKTNIFSCDSTLNHLVSHMQELGLSELRIINLFSIVVDGKLSAKGLQVDVDNLHYIESIMSDKSFAEYKFIIAWGNSMATSFACQRTKAEALNIFKKYHPKAKAFHITTSNDTIYVDFAHPLFLGIRASSDKWKLKEITITPQMLEIPEKA